MVKNNEERMRRQACGLPVSDLLCLSLGASSRRLYVTVVVNVTIRVDDLPEAFGALRRMRGQYAMRLPKPEKDRGSNC